MRVREPFGSRRGGTEGARLDVAVPQPGRSLGRVLLHAVAGWAACAGVMAVLLATVRLGAALTLHALAAPAIFALVARQYFRARGARKPLVVAALFTATVALLDLVVVAGAVQRSLAMFGSLVGTWLPFWLVFATTWATGELISTLPERAP